MPGEHRDFTVDRLDRLTGTGYNEPGTTEENTLDLLGNRESHTSRAGAVTSYGPVNPANEYADIDGQPVSYDEAGNLTVDQDGRQYFCDEKNRLIEIQDSGSATLAAYTYDALGRRITATIDGTTTRYYYDGHGVIEERGATDTLARYHAHRPGAEWREVGHQFSLIAIPAGGRQVVMATPTFDEARGTGALLVADADGNPLRVVELTGLSPYTLAVQP